MRVLLCVVAGLLLALPAPAQMNRPAPAAPNLQATVTDENRQPLGQAQVFLIPAGNRPALRADTDALGRVRFFSIPPGTYQLDVRKVGFYELRRSLQVARAATVEVALHHVEEFHETVEVSDSPPDIDAAKTESSETLTNREIFSLPYPSSRDFRNVLPFLPSVVHDFNINKDLPLRPRSTPVWRISSLTRAQVNISSANLLTADFLVNQEKSSRVGLGLQTPVGSTTDQGQFSYLAGLKDSLAISSQS